MQSCCFAHKTNCVLMLALLLLWLFVVCCCLLLCLPKIKQIN